MESLKDLLFILLLLMPVITVFITSFYLLRYKKDNIKLLNEIEELKKIAIEEKKLAYDLKKEIKCQQDYFSQTLMHDLKVPTLAQIRGLDLLKSENYGLLNNEQKDMIDQVQDSCKYMLDMISMMLKTNRIESNSKHLVYEKFNMTDLVLESFDENSTLMSEKGVTFELSESSKNIQVEADKNEIKKVIVNLLASAISYSNKFEKILVKITADKDSLSLSIVSNGIAMSKKECSTLFERFSNKKSRFTAVGQGISLYLCKKIIDMHSGKIFVLTDEKAQNSFNFVIPRCSHKLHFSPVPFLCI